MLLLGSALSGPASLRRGVKKWMTKEHFLLRGELIRLWIKFFILISHSKLRRRLKKINPKFN